VEVTATGRRLLHRHENARRAVFAQMLRDLSPADTRALLRGLEAVHKYVEQG
jgi:DNA-binding MarR family transcriptional regulator